MTIAAWLHDPPGILFDWLVISDILIQLVARKDISIMRIFAKNGEIVRVVETIETYDLLGVQGIETFVVETSWRVGVNVLVGARRQAGELRCRVTVSLIEGGRSATMQVQNGGTIRRNFALFPLSCSPPN